jgi:hypothetical protein
VLKTSGFSAGAQQSQTPPKAAPVAPYTIPADAVRQANPVTDRLTFFSERNEPAIAPNSGPEKLDALLDKSGFHTPP